MTKRSVIQRGCPSVNEDGTASETIKPGYLTKGISTIAKQTATTTGVPPVQIALERDELGQGIDNAHQGSGTTSAFYASGDRVKVGVFHKGERFVGFVASGQNIVEDDQLQSAGDGTFAEGSTKPIVRACETVGAVTVETAVILEVL
jgi:hypothetical protein